MKAVFVATLGGEKKLYYVVDSDSQNSDGVVDNEGKPKLVNFWKTVANSTDISPIKSTNFHKFLWDGAESEDRDSWVRIFINKTQSVERSMLAGIAINNDVMKSSIKKKSINNRAMDFKSAMITQNGSIIWRNNNG